MLPICGERHCGGRSQWSNPLRPSSHFFRNTFAKEVETGEVSIDQLATLLGGQSSHGPRALFQVGSDLQAALEAAVRASWKIRKQDIEQGDSCLHVVDHLRMQRSRRPWSGQHVGEISPRTMPSSRKVNLEKVQASLDAVCPKCGRMIPPAEVRRIDFERIECPECCARPDESLAPRLFLRVQRSSRPPPPPLLPLVCSCGGWDELLSS
jgi:hypothetical protein